jgi:hypothetical protein
MRRTAFRFVIVVVVATIAAVTAVSAQGRLLLFTPDEAAQLTIMPGERVAVPLMRSLPAGPRIIVRHPPVARTADGAVMETTGATRFAISFEENRAPVNMDSLDVKARKGPFSVSLTPRLKPYLNGTSLQAEAVSVPEGRFVIQIEIADTQGTRTTETYRLEVKRPG